MTLSESPLGWSSHLVSRASGSNGGAIAAIMAQTELPGAVTLSGGFPNPALFPAARVSAVTAELMNNDHAASMQYSPTRGLAGTRDAIAAWRETCDGRRPADPELMITSGGVDALELLATSLIEPGDSVVVEAPTYLGAIMAFRNHRATIHTVPMDDAGIDLDSLAALLRSGVRPKLLYTIPDHHNPTGICLDGARRGALVDLCRRYGVLIVEDVAYRDLSFNGEREDSLWAVGPDVTVQIGTFSKVFFPGIRLGWAAGPPIAVQAMVDAKQNSDHCAGAFGQRLAEEFLRSGDLDRHIARLRTFYAGQSRTLLSALERHMPAGVSWTVPNGGFFTWLTLPAGNDTVALSSAAAAAGVTYVAGPVFDAGGRFGNNLRLSYSSADGPDLDEGVARLAALLRS